MSDADRLDCGNRTGGPGGRGEPLRRSLEDRSDDGDIGYGRTGSTSMVRHLVEQGFMVFVLSWKNPDASMDEIAFEDYMALGVLPK